MGERLHGPSNCTQASDRREGWGRVSITNSSIRRAIVGVLAIEFNFVAPRETRVLAELLTSKLDRSLAGGSMRIVDWIAC